MHVIRLARPALPLREDVRFYAHREVRVGLQTVSHPVPARAFPLLEFTFGDRFQVVAADQFPTEMSPRTVLVGLQTHCRSRLIFQGAVECFVIMFQPTGLHRLFSIPADEITDKWYEARCVLGRFVSELEDLLADTDDFSERVRVTDGFLLRACFRARARDRICAATDQIVPLHGNVGVADLAREAGLGVRQFQRRFAQQVGVHPKLYTRIVRFEAALDSKARCCDKSWTDVAHEFGYYDQRHMIHDFESFTDRTPSTILKDVEQVFRQQIEAVRQGRRPISQDNLELIL